MVLCGPQLASMLGCWAATKDVKSLGPCRDHAQSLFECMRTAVRFPAFIFISRQGRETNECHPCSTAHEAETTQTVNQLPSSTVREDPKGLTIAYALAS